MTSRRKRDKLKGWISGIFPPKHEIHAPDGPVYPSGSVKNVQNVIVNNAIHVRGDNNMVVRQDGHEDRNIETQIMSLLSQHIIRGAAHDSSARTPPPRCHPDTRVKLIARITTWFDGEAQQELLLWMTGPAGVGKSAVVQTFAEYLAKSQHLGASVFVSRPNKRNNPHGIFITIAYQLAVRIEAYRNFIVERLRLDPELMSGDIQTQFMTFIVEPFVHKKIGAGGQRWGILLDGLDELRGEDAQCEIIELISSFVHNHRDTPLVWIIASRPESHISNMFDDEEVRRSCWIEYIPIDSTEACNDVECFLRSSFKTTQKKFRHSVPTDWPSDTDFLKLTAAASGLFVYAQVVMQFIKDSDHADPVSRFEVVLAAIDRSNVVPTKENPFVHLDALYHGILSLIPSTLWPTAKQMLGFTIYLDETRIVESTYSRIPKNLQTVRGMSILFGITRYAIYGSLNKCRSTLGIPDWKVAHKENLTFLHASFADYLRDSSRSQDFHVGDMKDVDDDAESRLLEIWNECSGDDIVSASIEAIWHRYCSKWDDKSPSRVITKFYANLFRDTVYYLGPVACRILEKPIESPIYAQLRKVNIRKLCYFFNPFDLLTFVVSLMEISPKSRDTGLLREVRLGDMEFGHLDWKEMSPALSHCGKSGKFSKEPRWMVNRPHSSAELKAFVSELESLKERSPKLSVVIFGGAPKGLVMVFRRPLKEESVGFDFMYYAIPYVESAST